MNTTSGDHGSRMRLLRLAVPTMAAAFLLSSCVTGSDGSSGDNGGGGESPADHEESADTVASAVTSGTKHKNNFKVDLNSLERIGGDKIILRMTAINATGSDINTIDLFGNQDYRPSGLSLVDTTNQKRHWPLTGADDDCICSDWSESEATWLAPDEEIEFWAAFTAPPDDVDNVAVTTYITPDFIGIPITDAENDSFEDIAEKETNGESEVWDLNLIEESDDSTREDSGDEASIMLSSDVLFDTDESELKPKAESTLQQVAEEIDDSSGETVNIDGYTDNTGNDSINEPLSEERAEAVHQELRNMVSRDVDFEISGHGSSDPVADNDTKEGRKKNRRVTVNFEK